MHAADLVLCEILFLSPDRRLIEQHRTLPVTETEADLPLERRTDCGAKYEESSDRWRRRADAVVSGARQLVQPSTHLARLVISGRHHTGRRLDNGRARRGRAGMKTASSLCYSSC